MTARILIVDDVPLNVKLLEAKLSAEYFEVLAASNGPDALVLAASEKPDLILLDVMMPGMDGFEVCRRVKAESATRHIPVVMVTALSDIADRVRGLGAGADDFLTKPVNDVALFARVRALTRLKVMLDELRVRQSASGIKTAVEDGGARDGGAQVLSDARILVADSHDFTAEKVTGVLTCDGHKIDRASTASEALECGRSQRYDLIIVAVEIAGDDGLRLCSQFRTQEGTRHVPLLLLLDEVDFPKLAKGLDLGVTDYLVKPIDRNELLARCRSQIRQRRYHDQLRALIDRSVSLAYTDGLTGLYNRRYMNAHLDRRIMEIDDSAKPVSVLMFDIDHFKRVNDSFGHAAGDAVLKVLAARVLDSLRDSDMVARFGGEEFVAILPDTPAEVARSVAERLCVRIAEQPFAIPGRDQPIRVTISIGVVTTVDAMEEAGGLMGRVDRALYDAKQSGRNCVRQAVAQQADETLGGTAAKSAATGT